MREKRPIGTRRSRIAKAVNWHLLEGRPREAIARELGVSPSTIDDYLASPEAETVLRMIARREAELRVSIVEDLKTDLQAAGARRRAAEDPDEQAEAREETRAVLGKITALVGVRGRQ